MLKTRVDKMVDLLSKRGRLNFRAIAKELSIPEEKVEKFALCMEKAGLAYLHYPINMIENPSITLIAKPAPPKAAMREGKLLKEYDIVKDGHIAGHVRILHSPEERRPLYLVELPESSPATRAYLESLKEEVSKEFQVWADERNMEESARVFAARKALIEEILRRDLDPGLELLDQTARLVLNEMYGLGEIETLVEDSRLEEVVVNAAKQPVSVYHKEFGWLRTNIHLASEADIENYSQQIARKVGRQISTLSPILDAHLGTGERVNATLHPISAYGNTITMRLFAKNPWTIASFVKKENNAMSIEMGALLWQ
ncbi:MAG: hypothetical protein V1827_01375, partial [Candidatus Micrarchaeota archaeon]